MHIFTRRTVVVRHKRLLQAFAMAILVSGISFQANETPTLPKIYAATFQPDTQLSSEDAAHYRVMFQAQSRADWDKADDALVSLGDQRLLGTILAARYLDERYDTTQDELVAWLRNYHDQPEAERIQSLAERKGVTKENLSSITAMDAVAGIGRVDTMGNAEMPASWYRGLALWKSHHVPDALAQFNKAASADRLTSWQRSAIAFWQYRAHSILKHDGLAQDALARAAQSPRTFYGMLANQVRGEPLALTALAPYVPDTIRAHASVRRAEALSQIGEGMLAEKELRHLYTQMPPSQRAALITIASELDLPNLQVRLGQADGIGTEEAVFASYPMPQWLSEKELTIDSALMFAISRQESSFATEVQSHAGATGLMQLMPSTANYIWKKSSSSLMASLDASALPESATRIAPSDLHDPKTNMLLGQEYVLYLMGKTNGQANLVHVLAGYNAGPGMVAVWNNAARSIDDPLLYIESIPYKETRHYVMQVMSNYWAYQSLMGKDTTSLSQLATGAWPTIAQPTR